ncbi:hypothetical protein PX699_13215 [Sphingobium sp. H39-3-25]|uniref:hypothetical protein n=1 Tax=Sphingobium arseniciresistens TaxID=3030834 RepID=UPI0023B8BAC2|nr:hypothetical protein [Sphingobium arseniciresistens]
MNMTNETHPAPSLREALLAARKIIALNIGDFGGILGKIEAALSSSPNQQEQGLQEDGAEMVKMLNQLADKQDGYGMSYRYRGDSNDQFNVWGDRARAAIWLFQNARKIAAALSALLQQAAWEAKVDDYRGIPGGYKAVSISDLIAEGSKLPGNFPNYADWAITLPAGHWRAIFQPLSTPTAQQAPVDMLLFCPRCHTQHIDEPDERTPEWDNPPHRSHLCHKCGCIWRPADIATNGVISITTVGKSDNWTAQQATRMPCPDLLDRSHDEATDWITANCTAIRRDNGDMDYSLGAMIAAYEAGKSSQQAATEAKPVAFLYTGPFGTYGFSHHQSPRHIDAGWTETPLYRHPTTRDEGEVDWLTKRVGEVVEEDGGCWTACSGCQESVDGYVSSKDYPRSRIFKCQPGSGCRECGGLGVIWQDGAFLAGYGEALCVTPKADPSERERIVAWLRNDAAATRGDLRQLHADKRLTTPQTMEWENLIALKSGIADAIERGDHLQAGEGE